MIVYSGGMGVWGGMVQACFNDLCLKLYGGIDSEVVGEDLLSLTWCDQTRVDFFTGSIG